MKMSEKLILVDCDGVLVDWVYSFDRWMERHGRKKLRDDVYDLAECYGIEKAEAKNFVKMFNESANIEYLPPLRDAVKYVRKLHEEYGYIFHCITSLSLDPFAQKLVSRTLRHCLVLPLLKKLSVLILELIKMKLWLNIRTVVVSGLRIKRKTPWLVCMPD